MDQDAPLLSGPDLQQGERKVLAVHRFGPFLNAAVALCRMQSWLSRTLKRQALLARILESVERLTGAMFSESLSIHEKSRLTVGIYDFHPSYKTVGSSLFPWEQTWFEGRMPRPPAHILVGACGTGREAIALVQQGYRVDALDPAPEFVAESRRRLGTSALVLQLSYEQLSAIVLASAADEDQRSARYDAVVLGYGSFAHVLDAREQRRLLRALDVLCPRGPILASFLCKQDGSSQPARTGRAERVGRSIGRALARLRRIPLGGAERLSYRARRGFAYTFTRREIEELAATVGRQVAWECGTVRAFHCAAFLPSGTRR